MSGDKMVRVQDGSERYACLFAYIEGVRPEEGKDSSAVFLRGEDGELVNALAVCSIGMKPVYPPYYESLQSYPVCNEAFILDFASAATGIQGSRRGTPFANRSIHRYMRSL